MQVDEICKAFDRAKNPASYNPIERKATCGGRTRDDKGNWIKGFTFSVGTCTPEAAEAWALLKGIQLAKLIGSRQTCFESNSLIVVKAINQNWKFNNVADNTVVACKRELNSIGTWQVSHIARDKNRAADLLAKAVIGENKMVIYNQPPDILLDTLEEDQFGLPIWRHTINDWV
nr:F-box/kelch-repeat protein At1g80440-like [Ipomoea batatas]